MRLMCRSARGFGMMPLVAALRMERAAAAKFSFAAVASLDSTDARNRFTRVPIPTRICRFRLLRFSDCR